MKSEYLNRIIDTYVVRRKRERFRELMNSDRRYSQFLHELLHDPKYFEFDLLYELAADERNAEAVFRLLRRLGADEVGYLVGDVGRYDDGSTGRLRELLGVCVGSQADALVYCPKANVAYYEGHEGFGYVLKKPLL